MRTGQGWAVPRAAVIAAALALAQPGAGLAQVPAAPPTAEASLLHLRRVEAVLRLAEVAALVEVESGAQADALAEALFPEGTGPDWRASVAGVNDAGRLLALLRPALAQAFAAEDAAVIAAALDLAATPELQRWTVLELSARAAMAEPDGEAAARHAFAHAADRALPRVAQVHALMAAADLGGRQTAAAMNGMLAFSRGLQESGAVQVPQTEAEMLAGIWQREGEIAAEVQGWTEAWLLLALSPLDDAEVARMTAVVTRPEVRALDRAVARAWEEVFLRTARETGLLAGRHLLGRRL